MKSIWKWLDHRTGLASLLHEALYERIPGGARWRYVWGSTLVFAFFVQVVTGFFLWASYSPNSQGAYESVYYIQHVMQYGWLLRGVHHFMAQAMIVLLILHLMQVIIDGAYRAPREFNFWIGLLLMMVVLGLSLTGYLLPWNQKGFWATKVATNIMAITPVVGPELQKIVIGGSDYGHQTLTRFFALHAGLLPAALVGLLMAHIFVFRRHGITTKKVDSKRDTTFWPDQVLRDAVACLAVLAVVLLLVCLPMISGDAQFGSQASELGAELGAPADRTDQFSAARPEWYFLFLFQLLKYFPGENEIIGSHFIPAAIMALMFLMPIFGKWKLGHRFNIVFVFSLLVGVGVLTGLAVRDDRNNPDYVTAKSSANRVAERVPELVDAEGIGTEGAVELVRNDPLLQGPKIFAAKCASCHRCNGHDGLGNTVMDGENPALQTATDLGNFGSREWIISVLVDFKGHFANLKNATNKKVAKTLLEDGQMVDWSNTDGATLKKKENKESLNALVEYLVKQSRRPDFDPIDVERAKKGKQVFHTGKLADGSSFNQNCKDCHAFQGVGETEINEDPEAGAPPLTGYAGENWLKNFITDPGKHYSDENNFMPAFREQLSKKEIDLLVRWMLKNYVPTKLTSR